MLHAFPSAAQIVFSFSQDPGALRIGNLKLHGTNFSDEILCQLQTFSVLGSGS